MGLGVQLSNTPRWAVFSSPGRPSLLPTNSCGGGMIGSLAPGGAPIINSSSEMGMGGGSPFTGVWS